MVERRRKGGKKEARNGTERTGENWVGVRTGYKVTAYRYRGIYV